MARPRSHARAAQASEAPAYLDKARQFLRAARDSLELANLTAAVGNAIHAGISASDAISVARTLTVWRGEHGGAPAHLDTAGQEGKAAARHLRRLLPLKTRVEYEPGPPSASAARQAVQAADRMVAIAAEVVGSQNPPKRPPA